TFLTITLPAGAGLNQPVTVFAAGQYSPTVLFLSYATPVVNQIIGSGCLNTSSGVTQCPRTGTLLTLLGSNFGAANAQVLVSFVLCLVCWSALALPELTV